MSIPWLYVIYIYIYVNRPNDAPLIPQWLGPTAAELRQWVSVMRSKRRQCHPPAEYHTLRGVQRALAPKSLVYDVYVEKNWNSTSFTPHTLSLSLGRESWSKFLNCQHCLYVVCFLSPLNHEIRGSLSLSRSCFSRKSHGSNKMHPAFSSNYINAQHLRCSYTSIYLGSGSWNVVFTCACDL